MSVSVRNFRKEPSSGSTVSFASDDGTPSERESSISSSSGGIKSNRVSLKSLAFRSLRQNLQQNVSEHSADSDDLLDGGFTALPTHRDLQKREKVSDSLPAARLKFSSLGLIGREDEIEVLNSCCRRMLDRRVKEDEESSLPVQNRGRELVLISGESGVGKSKLALALADRVKNAGGLFVQGKYDMYFNDDPYRGISTACSEICQHILELRRSDFQSFSRFKKDLLEELGDTIPILSRVIPMLEEITHGTTSRGTKASTFFRRDSYLRKTSVALDDTKNSISQSKEMFNIGFTRFIRTISSNFSGLVLYLDDLQWTDKGSFELLELLLSDPMYSNLMVIGTYRSDEVGDSHGLTALMSNLNGKHDKIRIRVTEISLGNLQLNGTVGLLSELLSLDKVDVESLAELCQIRCLGNPFHLVTFVQTLEQDGFISFDVCSFKWSWDLDAIKEKTSITPNVVSLVRGKLDRSPKDMQTTLNIAACLGASFHVDKLYMVLMELISCESVTVDDINSENDVNDLLQLAIDERILEPRSGDSFRWTHDKVKEACMLSGAGYDVCPRVGEILTDNLSDDELFDYIFVVVRLLSNADMLQWDNEKRLEMAELYLLASSKALDLSSFQSASKYATEGIQLLPRPDIAFAENYRLSLELYSIAAEMHALIGNDVDMQSYCDVVLQNALAPLDKFRCCKRLILELPIEEAKSMCVSYLNELGVKIPKNGGRRRVKALFALKKFASLSVDSFTCLPMAESKNIEASVYMADLLCYLSLKSKDEVLWILGTYYCIVLTLMHGITPQSVYAIGGIGVLHIYLRHFQKANDFARCELDIMKRFDSNTCKNIIAQAHVQIYGHLLPWTTPLPLMQKHLLEGYKVGLECGDTEFASWCIVSYIGSRFLCGSNLHGIKAECKRYLPQVVAFGREEQAFIIQIFLQMCLCLNFPSDESAQATVDVVEFREKHDAHYSIVVKASSHIIASFLCYILGEYEEGSNVALKEGNTSFKNASYSVLAMVEPFYRAISLYEMAHRTHKRKYKVSAEKIRSTLLKWVKSGNPNVQHRLAILEAERNRLNCNKEKAKECYRDAITQSTRCGMIHDAAMASERYGDYLLNELKDKAEAQRRLEASVRMYSEWGASVKVHRMKVKYSFLIKKEHS